MSRPAEEVGKRIPRGLKSARDDKKWAAYRHD
jgi:hypothetical protein